MFQEAVEQARRYTFPYAGLRRKHDGTVFSNVAAFVGVNADGWCITARHLFDEIARAEHSVRGAFGIERQIAQLEGEAARNPKERGREIRGLERRKADSLSNHVEIWAAGAGWDKVRLQATQVMAHPVADLAAFRLEPFTPSADQGYPVFRSLPLGPGLSVCRIGFPWHSVEAEFADGGFTVKSGFPAPLFAVEGMISRFRVDQRAEGEATYIETSTPGLRGQSGGPLFDVAGRLCGLQAFTAHLDLGFDAPYERAGQQIIERQFLNVGQAVHVDTITRFLDGAGIRYETG